MAPYKNLANAIIEQAAADYRKALRDLKRNPDYFPAQQMKADCEHFFQSKWMLELTMVDGPWLMSRLREEVL